jgi:curved DNA-binding protein CbpA
VAGKEYDPAFFQLVAEAYQTLSDPKKKEEYDLGAETDVQSLRRRNEGLREMSNIQDIRQYAEDAGSSQAGIYSSADHDRAHREQLARASARFRKHAEMRGAVARAQRFRVHVPSTKEQRLIFLGPIALLILIAFQAVGVQQGWFRRDKAKTVAGAH